nr:MAG TPA: hypothetical protein [Caudoviricetes sp.]DAY63418.1 MAG TPA: hypothetical protein [Caudoviricetes sp.]
MAKPYWPASAQIKTTKFSLHVKGTCPHQSGLTNLPERQCPSTYQYWQHK